MQQYSSEKISEGIKRLVLTLVIMISALQLAFSQISKGDSAVFQRTDSLYNVIYDLMLAGTSGDSTKKLTLDLIEETSIHQDSIALAYATRLYGTWHFFQGDFDGAIEQYELALEIASKRTSKGLARYYQALGVTYERKANFEQAFKYYTDGLNLASQESDTSSIILFSHGLMNSYRLTRENLKAIKYGLRGLNMALKLSHERIPNIMLDLAWNYQLVKKYDSAAYYTKRALEYIDPAKNVYLYYSANKRLGQTLRPSEAYDLALLHFNEALAIAEKYNWQAQLADMYHNKAMLYNDMNQYRDALDMLEKGIKLKLNHAQYVDLYSSKSYTHELAGEYVEALESYKMFNKYYDSLRDQRYKKDIAELEVRFETLEKEREVEKLNKDVLLLETQQQIAKLRLIIIIVVTAIILLAGFFIARFLILKKERKSRELKEISDFKEAMTGMIAHDLKNPLSILLNYNGGDQTTKQMAGQMLQLVNNMIDVHKFESTEVKLNLEGCLIEQIAGEAVDQVRHLLVEKNIKVSLNLDATPVLVDKIILVRVMVNFLTNAIKFSPANSEILINSTEQDELVSIAIKDQGKGIPGDDIEKVFESFGQLEALASGGVGSTGLGLTFCKLALAAHGSEINVVSEEGTGTTFTFTLRKANSIADNSTVEQTESYVFTIPKEDLKYILEKVPVLRAMKLYQAPEMEQILESVKSRSEASSNWVDSVLNAAYSGNQQYFDELLKLPEKEKH